MHDKKLKLTKPHCKYCKYVTSMGGCVKHIEKYGTKTRGYKLKLRKCELFELTEFFSQYYIYKKEN